MTHWTVFSLRNRKKVAQCLEGQGFHPDVAAAKAEVFARSSVLLEDCDVPLRKPAFACFVPGRIEVLGKHTDYAGGRSMVAALDRGFCTVVVPRDDRTIRVVGDDSCVAAEFPLSPDIKPPVGRWTNYPMTVARRIARNFPGELKGADIGFASDLPIASGMSSSSALMIAAFLALSKVNRLDEREAYQQHIHSTEDLAGYLGTVENGQSFGELAGDAGVGTFGGSEDHTAILCSQPGRISQYSYCPVTFERHVIVPDDLVFVIAFSGVAAEKTGDALEKYNRVSRLAQAAMEVWRESTGRDDPHFAAVVGAFPDGADRLRDVLSAARHPQFSSQELVDRFDQFYVESEEIIPAAPNDLSRSQAQFGELVDRSQQLGAQILANQSPETVFLAEEARNLGAIAASAFGAGFGGSVWALMSWEESFDIGDEWARRYRDRFPDAADYSSFFISRPGPGAFLLE